MNTRTEGSVALQMGIFDVLKTIFEPDEKKTVARTPASTTEKSVNQKEVSIKVTDSAELENHLQIKEPLPPLEKTFFCPIRRAKVFCHSVMIDKLGDLTKFIIAALFKGHTIEEISGLTQIGDAALKEELDYLSRCRLIDDTENLTKLGSQYGQLLGLFAELDKGIDMAFNVFADAFEPIEEDKYVCEPDPEYILHDHFIPELARNDNYANSLRIAQGKIEPRFPFRPEIINSLYATVQIEKAEMGYKAVRIYDFDKGSTSEIGPCVKLAIPYDRISCRPRYRRIDAYRDVLPLLKEINETNDDMLSDKAKRVIREAREEDEADIITKDVNTVTGSINRRRDNLVLSPDDRSIIIDERQPVQLVIKEETSTGLYLEETDREQLYKILYYPYKPKEG